MKKYIFINSLILFTYLNSEKVFGQVNQEKYPKKYFTIVKGGGTENIPKPLDSESLCKKINLISYDKNKLFDSADGRNMFLFIELKMHFIKGNLNLITDPFPRDNKQFFDDKIATVLKETEWAVKIKNKNETYFFRCVIGHDGISDISISDIQNAGILLCK